MSKPDPNVAPSMGAPYQGELGQTRRMPKAVVGEGGVAFQTALVVQINAATDPELRAQLIGGTLNVAFDPETGRRYVLAEPVVYHDPRRRIFGLFLGDGLRHRELEQRAALLERLAATGEPLPPYVRELCVCFSGADLERLEAMRGGGVAPRAPQVVAPPMPKPIAAPKPVAAPVSVLDQTPEGSHEDAPTMVVSRDMIEGSASAHAEAASVGDPEAILAGAPSVLDAPRVNDGWTTSLEAGWELEGEGEASDGPLGLGDLSPLGLSELSGDEAESSDGPAPEFNRIQAGASERYFLTTGETPILAHRLDDARIARFEASEVRLYAQLHALEAYPLVVLLVAAHARVDESIVEDAVWWPLDVTRPADRALLARLRDRFSAHVALYGEDQRLQWTMTFTQPLELNVRRILERAEALLDEPGGDDRSFEAAAARYGEDDFPRLGELQHNFRQDAFQDIGTPSQARLAAGIVGYWSSPDTFRYLIEERAFSLGWFTQIQERVVTASVRFGIAMSPELRAIALKMKIAFNDAELLRVLASAWAQTCLGVMGARNDMDPLTEWENWHDLIDGLEAHGEELDDDLSTLAQASLRRAQEYARANDLLDDEDDEEPEDAPVAAPEDAPEYDGLTDEALLDMLEQPAHRLAAARRLVRDGESDHVLDVLMAAEAMPEDDVESLSDALSQNATRHEDMLIEALALDNPTVTLLCSFALCALPSAKARPELVKAYLDPKRTPDPALLATALTMYGAGLIEELEPHLKSATDLGPEHPLVVVLVELAQVDDAEATLSAVEACAPEVASHVRDAL